MDKMANLLRITSYSRYFCCVICRLIIENVLNGQYFCVSKAIDTDIRITSLL